MKARIAVVVSALLVALPFASGAEKAQTAIAGSTRSAAVLDVSTLMREAEKHQGPIRVEGVVSRVYPKDQKLGLIDTAEFKRCGVVTCADLVLPVRWAGAMPEPKTQVRLEGEIRKSGEGMEFVANALEKVAAK